MNIRLFNRRYPVRRFGPDIEVGGYSAASFEDFEVSVHIHPSGGDTVSDLDGSGETVSRHLEGHGEIPLRIADRDAGTRADLLYFGGHWYECISCEHWFHTLLEHYNYRFTLVPEKSVGATADLAPPSVTEDDPGPSPETPDESESEGGAEGGEGS